ncbi:MAG: putative 2OG-Fe(II) oxygenase [Gammaproteobacteria bacterium]
MTFAAQSDPISFDETVEVHYPTTVLERRHHGCEDLNTALYTLLKNLTEIHRDDRLENAIYSGRISTQGGYQTAKHRNFLERPEPAIAEFRDRILLPSVTRYLTEVFGQSASAIKPWIMGWANFLTAGDWQAPHMHPTTGNLASGVYYVRLPEAKDPPQGWIEFLNPHPISVHHGFTLTRRIEPEAGKLLLFPPYHIHYVHPFRGAGERAIIAFDVLKERPDLKLTF